MTLEEFIEGAKDHEDIMDMLKNLMDLTPVLKIIVQGRGKWECRAGPKTEAEILLTPVETKRNHPSLSSKWREKTSCIILKFSGQSEAASNFLMNCDRSLASECPTAPPGVGLEKEQRFYRTDERIL